MVRQSIDPSHLDDAKVRPAFEQLERALFEVRGCHHLEVVFRNERRRFPVHRAIEHQAAAEGGNAVGAIGTVIGLEQTPAVGRAAGVVVLENDRRRLGHQILENIEAIVQVGEIDFAGVLPLLEHVRLFNGTHQPIVGIDEPTATQGKIPADQLIEGRLLARVLTVAQPLFNEFPRFVVGEFPGSLAIDQFLVPEADAKRVGKVVFHHRPVHFFQVLTHGSSSLE